MSKVIIPNFVAAHIENDKDINFSIHESINPGYMNDSNDKVNRWLYDNSVEENDKRILTFVRAWVEGYEIEPELKYYWRINLNHVIEPLYLITDIYSESYDVGNVDDIECARKLTEQEARDLLKDDLDKFEKVEIN